MAQPHDVNLTLGTAGHVDHGKTALVKCLTGCETDRLREEKERGMSIELGFAPCTIADVQVGIVDVPGHENFVKTMVAGATGIDAVLLVVAADDGVMPETREHLEILTLLGVRHGLVALTKIDRVDPEHRQLARAEVEALLQGTFLERAPVLPVSSVTGEGFDPFLEALDALVHSIRPKPTHGVFRLPVERAFSVQGYGTVLAGIPVAGSARAGDEVVLWPQGWTGRIRRAEVYGRPSDAVLAGQCAALNVAHWDHRAIARGDVLALPGFFSPQDWCLAKLTLLKREKLVLKSGAAVKFHTGTAEIPAVVYPLESSIMRGGSDGLVMIRLQRPVVAGPGDPFIVRTLSPVETVGGGIVVETMDRRPRRNRPAVVQDLVERSEAAADPAQFAEYCIRRAEEMAAKEDEVAFRAKIPRDRLREILQDLAQQQRVDTVGPGRWIHCDTLREGCERVRGAVADFHDRSPASPGILPDELRQVVGLDKEVLDASICRLRETGQLIERAGRVALARHQPAFSGNEARHAEAVEALLRERLFAPPGVDELAAMIGADKSVVERIVRTLCEHQRLVRVAPGLLFHREAIDRAGGILVEHLQRESRLESVRFKYLLDTTRKYAIPLLDYFDSVGVTRRAGNTRYLRAQPK